MTVELAQPHAASKASDSRFKSLHGKSQSQPAVGFQSILSAAADAPSEAVSSGVQLLQAANDTATKDAKDKQHPQSMLLQADEQLPSIPNNVPDVTGTATNTTQSAQVPTVAEQVSALLSQSRFAQGNTANVQQVPVQPQTYVPPALTANAPPIKSDLPVAESLQAQTLATPVLATNASSPVQTATTTTAIATTSLALAPTTLLAKSDLSLVGASQHVPSNVQQVAAHVQDLTPLPETQAGTLPTTALNNATHQAIPVAGESDAVLDESVIASAEMPAVTAAPITTEITRDKESDFAQLPIVPNQLPLPPLPQVLSAAVTSKPMVADVSTAIRPSASTKDAAPASTLPVFQALGALPTQALSSQAVPSASNQEIKILEAAKVAAIQLSPPTLFARLGVQEPQERTAKASGFNEFKPWAPGSFVSSRTSESSGASAGKDASSALGANTTQPVALPSQTPSVDTKFNQPMDTNTTAPIATEALVVPGVVTEREILREEHAVFKTNQPDVVPDLQTYAPTGADTSFTIATADGAVPLETYVAEQVTYWINQDVQNAELKLEGIGLEPVQVNITMQGNEAFVTFTTDEQQAREALENARQQLQDMLQSQGVILSGLSVGSNSTGNSGSQSQERNPRQANKQTVVASVTPQMQENRPRAGRSTGSTLDLFV